MPAPSPFRVERRESVLTLWLDTPGSRVNVFSVPAAEELRALVTSVDPATTRAIVIRSAKPRSFVNGVGLMLANAVRTKEDAARLTEPVTAAYAALRDSPVPTVAVIEGNCFGCGVELSLHCQRRIAIESVDTEFYMTEIADYLFVPVFGSTADLPGRVGIDAAIDFLVWGRKWGPEQALAAGLVDAVLPASPTDEAIDAAVARVLSVAPVERRDPEDAIAVAASRAASRIAELPRDQRPVHEACVALLLASARGASDYESRRADERLACGRSAMSIHSKEAQGFFFLREGADLRSRGTFRAPIRRVVLGGSAALARAYPSLSDAHVSRRIDPGGPKEVVVEHTTIDRLPLVEGCDPVDGDEEHVRVHRGSLGLPFLEVVGASDAARAVHAGLERARLRSVRTRSRAVGLALREAFVAPIARALAAGAAPRTVARSLREFGFVRLPDDLAEDRIDPVALVAPDDEGPTDAVAAAVVVSILGWALEALATRSVDHPSIADVLAVDLLGYPVSRGGPCRGARIEAVRDLLLSHPTLVTLLDPEVLTRVTTYVDHGLPLYRS